MKEKFYNLFRIISEFGLYGLLFFLAISNALVESFVGVVLLGFVGRKIIKPDFKFLKFWPNIFLLLFLFFSAISLFNSGTYLKISLNALFGKWMQYLGICIIIQDNVYEKKIIKRAMYIFLCGASLAVLSGLSQYFFGIEFLRNKGVSDMVQGMRPVTSSFSHYNSFAGYLVVVILLTITLLLEKNFFNLKAISLLILSIVSSAAILLTCSRGSWIAFVCTFVFLMFISRRNLIWLAPVFLLVFYIFLLFQPLHERFLFSFSSTGDNDRFRYWLVAWKMINEHPFLGIGVGTFMANFSKYIKDYNASYAHNCYLQIWAETGIFSLISFMVFIVSLIYLSIKKFFASKDFLLLGLLTGAVGFLIHSFFEVNFYSLRLAILFWIWIGLIAGRTQRA